MSQGQPVPIDTPACPLCSTAVSAADDRCPACGYDLAGVGDRPSPISRVALLWSAIGLLAVYLVTLAIVAATR